MEGRWGEMDHKAHRKALHEVCGKETSAGSIKEGRMKKAIVMVDCCFHCPKYWAGKCTMLDKEVRLDTIDPDCPLEDSAE